MKPFLAALLLAPTSVSAQPFVPMASDPWPTVYALMESQDCWASEEQLMTLFHQVFGFPPYQVVQLFNDMSPNPDLEFGASVGAWALIAGPRCGQ